MSTMTPNLGLVLPTINVDTGLVWEQATNANSTTIDNHDHSPGSGAQIQPSGININSDFTFNNNSATDLTSIVFTPQISLSTLTALYVIGADLYYNDGASNVIRMTSGGTVNATSSGISSGTATASFVGSVLVVNAAANTPANIQAGSILIGNNVVNSKFLTLAPPAAMAANYTVTLPPLPASQKFMTLDASGNITAPWAVDNSTLEISANTLQVKALGIGNAQLGTNSVSAGKIQDGVVTNPKLAALGQQISGSSGAFTTTSTSFIDVTNLSVTITVTGRPVYIGLIAATNNSSGVTIEPSTGAQTLVFGIIRILKDGSLIASGQWNISGASSTLLSLTTSLAGFCYIDLASAGTYTYKIQAEAGTSSRITIGNTRLIVYEL